MLGTKAHKRRRWSMLRGAGVRRLAWTGEEGEKKSGSQVGCLESWSQRGNLVVNDKLAK